MRDVYVGFTQIDDIINEGVIVLMKALDKYDFSKNAKFETYVSWRIRGMIIDIARKQDWVPRNIRKNCKDIREKTMEIYTRTGALPAPEEVAVTLGMDQKQYNEAVRKDGAVFGAFSGHGAGGVTGKAARFRYSVHRCGEQRRSSIWRTS